MSKNKSIYIQDNVINDFEQDTFGHKHIADAIVNSILTTNPPFTIGVFGGWGSGKSSLLELIKSKLEKEKIQTVMIDAWRYSSAENLRRAFLVHVVNELVPSLLDELKRKLYTSEQETIPERPSKLERPKFIFRDFLFGIVKTFLVMIFFFGGFLIIVYIIKTAVVAGGFSTVFSQLFWTGYIDKFMELAFVPFLLTLINYLQLYVIQRSITVIQEKIDADELFSGYFEKVVQVVLKRPFSKKKLVLFVDNLDRLTDDKMIEALESLKTYLVNNQCVFVVACDDKVVRSVVNNSPKIPGIEGNHNGSGKAGEHYLDKFFQQTFRLPEYMAISLSDFALKNFETTRLYNDLRSKNIDIRNLVSIILPSDVNSPRKVKRLLNEFISLHEIVKRRESEGDGQLKSGMLTDNIEFLGKISTIRAEYPVFYKALTENTNFINIISNSFQRQEKSDTDNLVMWSDTYSDSLIRYLRKTQTILVEDVDPYIWLSQDTLTLGLKGNHNNILRKALSDGDIDQVRLIINSSEDPQYQALLAIVASRTVEQRLIGIEQRNGVKVISHLLPVFSETLKPEIAHVAAKLIPSWTIDNFSADEVFNVLRWARMGGIDTQRKKLVARILDRLKDLELRQPTFQAILQNADVIEQNNATEHVCVWLAEILSVDYQKINLTEDNAGSSDDSLDQNKPNRDFVEWLIAQAGEYTGNRLVIRNYFSQDLIDFMVSRLLGDFENSPKIYIDDEESLGLDIKKALNIVALEIEKGLECHKYWEGLLRILQESSYLPEIMYSLEKINCLMKYFPLAFDEQFLERMLNSICTLVRDSDENKVTNEIISVMQYVKQMILSLRKRRNNPFDNNQLNKFTDSLVCLLEFPELCKEIIQFIETYFEEFGKEDSLSFINGITSAFEKYGNDPIIGDLLLDTLNRWDQFVAPAKKIDIVEKISLLFMSNDINLIELSINFLSKVIILEEYKLIIKKYVDNWRENFGADEPTLLQRKLDFYNILIEADVLNSNDLTDTIIPHLPFSGNQDQLAIIIGELHIIQEKLSNDCGTNLFIAVINHMDLFGSYTLIGLKLISRWIENVDETMRSKFQMYAYQAFSTNCDEVIEILSTTWNAFTETETENHIKQLYSVKFNDDSRAKRDLCVVKGLNVVPEDRRASFVHSVWDELIDKGYDADQFMITAVEFIPIHTLIELREEAMVNIRENGASPSSEVGLRLLATTIRKDVREVMPIVDLFVNLFGRGQADVQMALKYVVPCIEPLGIRNDHKHKLAEAMGQAALRTEVKEINDEIHDKAERIGLKWFSYRKYW